MKAMDPTDTRIAHISQKKFFSKDDLIVECVDVTFRSGDKSLLYALGITPYQGESYDLKHSRHRKDQQRTSGDIVGPL